MGRNRQRSGRSIQARRRFLAGLPANPLPEPVLAGTGRHEVVFAGGMMGGGMVRGGAPNEQWRGSGAR